LPPDTTKELDVVIRRVGPLSCAKVVGLLYLILGFVFGGVLSLLAMAGLFAGEASRGTIIGAIFGVGAVVLLPICYAAFGFVMTLVMTWLFNLVVGITGGIEVDAY
jgi:hypothetical protein